MNTFKIEAVFIDRDGTLGGTDEVILPGAFELFPGAKESIYKLKNAGMKLYGFTNQPGISAGKVTIQQFEDELLQFGLDGAYICPHQHHEGCTCRKPNPGMLQRAAKENGLNLSNCIVIGDRWSDIVAADQAGCKKILVLTGAGNDALSKYRHKWTGVDATYIANDFEEAAEYVIKIGHQLT